MSSSRVVMVAGVPFFVEYTVDIVDGGTAFAPTFLAIHLTDNPVIHRGPNLVGFLDDMYFRHGNEMIPVISFIAIEVMRAEVH